MNVRAGDEGFPDGISIFLEESFLNNSPGPYSRRRGPVQAFLPFSRAPWEGGGPLILLLFYPRSGPIRASFLFA